MSEPPAPAPPDPPTPEPSASEPGASEPEPPLRFDEPSIAGAPVTRTTPDAAEPVRVIVKVTEPGYVPEGFDVRIRVDDVLFTAEVSERDLRAAAADPNVESVERSRTLHNP